MRYLVAYIVLVAYMVLVYAVSAANPPAYQRTQLTSIPPDFGPINFTDTYSESILSIGNIGTRNHPANTSASFKGCFFSFVQAAPQEIDYHATFGCTTVFDGCTFLTADLGALHFLTLSADSAASSVTFIGCQFRANIGSEAPYLMFDRWERVRFIECGIFDTGNVIGNHRAQWWNPNLFSRTLVLPGETIFTGTNFWACYGLFPEVDVQETSTVFDSRNGNYRWNFYYIHKRFCDYAVTSSQRNDGGNSTL